MQVRQGAWRGATLPSRWGSLSPLLRTKRTAARRFVLRGRRNSQSPFPVFSSRRFRANHATAGMRDSASSTSYTSSGGPIDRTFARPQLSESEKEAVER